MPRRFEGSGFPFSEANEGFSDTALSRVVVCCASEFPTLAPGELECLAVEPVISTSKDLMKYNNTDMTS